MESMSIVNIDLPDDLFERALRMATSKGMTLDMLIQEALEKGLDEYDRRGEEHHAQNLP